MSTRAFNSRIAVVTIANGGTASPLLKCREAFEDADYITIFSPAVLDAGITFTLQVTDNVDLATVVMNTWQLGPTGPVNANLPAATYALPYFGLEGVDGLQIVASGAVGAARSFRLMKHFRT